MAAHTHTHTIRSVIILSQIDKMHHIVIFQYAKGVETSFFPIFNLFRYNRQNAPYRL